MRAAILIIGACLYVTLLTAGPASSEPVSFRLLDVDGADVRTPVPTPPPMPASPRATGGAEGSRHIREILQLERRTSTPAHALIVKESGLRYVRNLSDFRLLASSAFESQSNAYKTARSEFIVRHIPHIVRAARARGQTGAQAIEEILKLEQMTTEVDHRIAVKTAGLALVRGEEDFNALARSTSTNRRYLKAVSAFVAGRNPRFRASGNRYP